MAVKRFDGDWETLIREVRQGPMVRSASRHSIGLTVFVDEIVSRLKIKKARDRQLIKNALLRHARQKGAGRNGYDHTVKDILTSYAELWGGSLDLGCQSLLILEEHGFRYPTSAQTVRAITAAAQQFNQVLTMVGERGDMMRDAVLTIFEGTGVGELDTKWVISSFQVFVHMLADALGWNCRKRSAGDVAIAPVGVLELFGQNPRSLCVIDTTVLASDRQTALAEQAMLDGWVMLVRASRRGVSEEILQMAAKRMTPRQFNELNRWVVEGEIDVELYEEAIREAPDLSGVNPHDMHTLLTNWGAIGRRIPLAQLAEVGGTVESLAAYEESQRVALFQKQAEQLEAARRKRASEGEGGIDFDWMVAELLVTDLFPEIDGLGAGTILVLGILRRGDRIRSVRQLEAVRERKVWRQCRLSFEDDKARFQSALKELLQEGILDKRGDSYKLGNPTHKQTNARALVERVKNLAKRHAK